MSKDKTCIIGHYGFMEDELVDSFLIELGEAKPVTRVAPDTLPTSECNCGKCGKSLNLR
jgi:hypothetical protein